MGQVGWRNKYCTTHHASEVKHQTCSGYRTKPPGTPKFNVAVQYIFLLKGGQIFAINAELGGSGGNLSKTAPEKLAKHDVTKRCNISSFACPLTGPA